MAGDGESYPKLRAGKAGERVEVDKADRLDDLVHHKGNTESNKRKIHDQMLCAYCEVQYCQRESSVRTMNESECELSI